LKTCTQDIKFNQKTDAYYNGRYIGNVKVLNTVLYMSIQGTILNTVCVFNYFVFYISINSPQLWHEDRYSNHIHKPS
jgi:hypothetical protein